MSRKREQLRENKRELARQLGVSGKEVPSALIENERVTEPRLLLSTLSVGVVKRGFLQKPQKTSLAVALYVVDRSGARKVRTVCGHATVAKVGSVAVEGVVSVVRDGDEVVRYRRPGHFVVVAVAAEGAAVNVDAFDSDAFALVVGGGTVAIGSAEVGKLTVPASAGVAAGVAAGGAAVFTGEAVWRAAAVVAVAVVDRVKTTLQLPLHSDDGRFVATLSVDVRL